MRRAAAISWERELPPLIFMVMETAWLIVVYDLLNLAAGSPARLSPGLCCLLYPAAYLWGRLLRPRRLSPLKKLFLDLAAAALAAALTAGLVLLPPSALGFGQPLREIVGRAPLAGWLMALGWAGFAWLRGWYLAGRKVDYRGLAGGFQMGLAVFLVALPFSGLLGPGTARIWALLSAFFAFGLGGLHLAGRSRSGAQDRGAPNAPWLILALLALGAVLALGYAIWALVDRELVELLISPVLWLWDRFTDLLALLARLLPRPKPVPLPDNWATIPHLAAPPFKGPPLDLAWLRKVAEFVFIAATLAIVGMALFRSLTDLLKWLRRRFSGPAPEAVTVSDYGLLDDLKALFRALVSWFGRLFRRRRKGADELAGLSPEARTVRETYRRFLLWGKSKGRPKGPSLTPHEYQSLISLALPGREDDLGLLTEAYVLVRYGGTEPSPDLTALVRTAWKKIRTSKPIEQTGETKP